MRILDRAATVPKPPAVGGFEHIQRYWDGRTGHWCAKILPGEFYVTRNIEAVNTVLGSCIAACVRDVQTGVGGMNHFMLPEDQSSGADSWASGNGTPSTRYGTYAMESLINEILKLGAHRGRLELKLFGGGRILPSMTDVGLRNIEFAKSFARIEQLRVVAADVGGNVPRHVIYFPSTGRVLLKRLRPLDTKAVAEHDLQYQASLAAKPAEADVELFE